MKYHCAGVYPSFNFCVDSSALEKHENFQLYCSFYIYEDYFSLHQVANLITQHLLTQSATDSVIMETDDATPTTSSAVSEIRDPLNETFTVVLGSGEMFRCSVLQLFRHPTGYINYVIR